MTRFGISQPIRRLEDKELIRGGGRYSDDMFPGEGLAIHFLRCPHAHARLTRLDCDAARKADGVKMVATQAELDADGVAGIQILHHPEQPDGSKMADSSKTAMVGLGKDAQYAGDIVAMVVAETRQAARDAAELITAEYDPLPAVTDILAALEDGAPQAHPAYPGNLAFEWHFGKIAETEAAFDAAAQKTRILKFDIVNNRVLSSPMETRAMVARPMENEDGLELWTGSQGVVGLAEQVAAALGLETGQVHLRVRDVGGGFGPKIFLHPEQIAIAWAARKLGALVRWQQDRSEAFISDLHGRDNRSIARLVIGDDGRIHAYEVTLHANMGGWISNNGAFIPTEAGSGVLTGCYDIPIAALKVKGVMTNTPAVDAYRGAGRPEANYLLERVLDLAAAELGMARDVIRRRNMIPPAKMPYKMAGGDTIDSGEIEALMDTAMQKADWKGFARRRDESAKAGMKRGIGIGMYMERCGGGEENDIALHFAHDGSLTALVSQQDNGQGHRTTLTQILSTRLGYDAEKITIVQGDSRLTPAGTTGGARMTAVLGSTVHMAAGKVIARATEDAAMRLEAGNAEDIVFDDGVFSRKGTNRTVSLAELVEAAEGGDGEAHPYSLRHSHANDGASFPYGCHIAEVEIDPATLVVKIPRYTIVDDFGAVINPMTLEGQIHGGVAQGVGQALLEYLPYDDEGQLLAGSLMDYALPRADHLPFFDISTRNTPCRNNPLGVKGSGEAGAIGAPQAIISAVCDALGIDHINMPATPQRIWERLRAA